MQPPYRLENDVSVGSAATFSSRSKVKTGLRPFFL